MKVLVVIGHQNVGSFCHAIAQTAVEQLTANGHEVVFHDLYREGFDPVLPHEEIPPDAPLPEEIAQHCREIVEVDGYVVVHPNWWAQPPAVLKGWIDRVFRQGVTYRFGEGGVIGRLGGKTAVVITTSNTPRDVELSAYGDPLQNLWENCLFGFCGVENFSRRNFESVIMSSLEDRRRWLSELRGIVKKHL